jgi:hypothetical protein
MPRGRSKQAYGNRTDLNGKIPKAAPTGMPYGENKKLMDAQAAVPMGTPEMAAPDPMAAPAEPTMVSAMSQQAEPTRVVPLSAPSEFPDEDISQGLLPRSNQQVDPDITRLKETYLPLFMQEAGNPNAPVMFRDFVKWLNNL